MQQRQVQTLRIRARQPEQARHAAVELEDALRTASFGNLPRNGVVYIRRLDLGVIGTKPERAKLSRHIERSLWSLPASAIRRVTASDDLPTAEAVWFPTPAAALCAVVERIARGQSLRAWYWRRVLGIEPERRVEVTEATVIAAAERVAPAAQTVLSVLRHIDRLGRLPALAARLPAPRLTSQRDWLRSRVVAEPVPSEPRFSPTQIAHAITPSPPLAGAPVQGLLTRLPAGSRLQLQAALQQGVDQPERLQWLLLACHELAGVSLSAQDWNVLESFTREPAADVVARQFARNTPASPVPASRREPTTVPVAAPQMTEMLTDYLPDQSPALADTLPEPIETDPYAPRILRRRPFPDTDFNWAGSWLWGGRPTPAAGLLFLWPIWQHLGLSRALTAHPWLAEADFPACLLKRLGQWLGLAGDEPMLAWLNAGDREAAGEWQAPPEWRQLLQPQLQRFGVQHRQIGGQRAELALSGRVLLSLAGASDRGGEQLPVLADSWLRLSARWLYSHGLHIRRLVERPGAVAATDTHLDICLKVEDSDLQIRRLGLDIDPGWQPALGRVVQYHYIQREDGDA